MATIKPIEGRSVHQIQSGQVIVDLCSVAKELVENSIDAGATSIEVRFKNNGLDAIEVQDNGAGIAPEDFDSIALKHYTSKLSTYTDLTSLRTFGFRGEALSSLCALSKFHIITARSVDVPKGSKLEFEQSGKLRGTSVVAAKQGTTVVVEDLFWNLPVRRKELEKTVKREYGRVLALLNAYACISTGVKFVVSNVVAKGKKTVAFATQGNPNTKENIANVYGAKALLNLIPLNLTFEMDPSNRGAGLTQSARSWGTQDDGSKEIKIVGHISRPVVGEGRQTHDRQMFFVNSRPCILPQVAKAFNEVYKSYNVTQTAFIFADILLDTNAYDVNVSPDKRTILLHDQTALLENLKNALVELFEGHDQSVPQAQLLDRRLPAFKPPSMQPRMSTNSIGRDSVDVAETSDTDEVARREEVDEPPEPQDSTEPARTGFVKATLIDRFASRNTEERTAPRPTRARKSVPAEEDDTLFVSDREDSDPPDNTVQRKSLSAKPTDAQASASPRAAQSFNARVASQHAKDLAARRMPGEPASDDGEEEEEQPKIPAIKQTPQSRSTQSTIQNAFDRMRPMRTPLQQATITVGDTTTISTIGSSTRASKKSQIHTPKFSLSGKPLSQTPKKPLFMKSLRAFVAPGTQMEESDEDGEGEEVEGVEEEEQPESSMTDLPIHSPSPRKRVLNEETTFEPNTDLSIEESRTPSPDPAPPTVDEEEVDAEENQADPQEANDGSDDEYIDDTEKKAREEAKIEQMIVDAEEAAARPSEMNLKRANKLFQASKKRYTTLNTVKSIEASPDAIRNHIQKLEAALQEASASDEPSTAPSTSTQLDPSNPEERLSLTVTKSDFSKMRIIGQFNLGFILAVRPPSTTSPTSDLFIIDQHASDEKYNFEAFTANTVLVSQRLVHPHPLELTAIEEELILNNAHALSANGFIVSIDTTSTTLPVGQRAKLTSLPMSKEVTFTPTDLEELLALLIDNPTPNPSSASSSSSTLQSQKYIPRPSKVRKLLASRACRASIMIGKTLDKKKMEKVVRHMGEMDKPWSCPHGRPTMRHLFGLERWAGWREGDGVVGIGDGDGDGDGDCARNEAVNQSGVCDWGKYLDGVRARRGLQ